MIVVGFWLPVTLNILFSLVKSVSIVLSGQFFLSENLPFVWSLSCFCYGTCY